MHHFACLQWHFPLLMALSRHHDFFLLIEWWRLCPHTLHFGFTLFASILFRFPDLCGALLPHCGFGGAFYLIHVFLAAPAPIISGFTPFSYLFCHFIASDIAFSAILLFRRHLVSGGISTSSCSLITESPNCRFA